MTFGYDERLKQKCHIVRPWQTIYGLTIPTLDDYNRWVKKSETHAASYEMMKREDNLYKYGIVIDYNTDPVIKGNGSAIFLHIWKSEGIPTAGCVAVSEEDIIKILGWLDPAASPLMIMGISELDGDFTDEIKNYFLYS